ncbi:MAG: hypothetical protein ABF337_11385 [Akkermansiaceae bacterium]
MDGAVPTNSGHSNLDRVKTKFLFDFSDDNQAMIEFAGAAAEPIILGAADIDWLFRVGVEIGDPLNPTYFFSGKHDGFPAYEIYINANHAFFPVTEVLQWKPNEALGVEALIGDADVLLPGIPYKPIKQ